MNFKLKEENKFWKKGYKRVACLDEVGRGSLSGPVVAAAVFIKKAKLDLKEKNFKILLKEVEDSKKLSFKKREKLYKIITDHPAIKWGIGRVSEKVIDRINILEATKLAMKRAIQKLDKKPDYLILDGNFRINSDIFQKSIVKADDKVFSCMCASIIAKVYRDRLMVNYHKKYSQYGFDRHKGYPTKFHKKMIKKYDFCKLHRKTFSF